MSDNAVVQQALLKLEFAHLYPGLVPNEWQPAKLMLEQVNALAQRGRSLSRAGTRDALDPTHFALRGTVSAGARQMAREVGLLRRKRPR